MRPEWKPVARCTAVLAALDFAGIAFLIAYPKLTERVIPALVLIQLGGAAYIVMALRKYYRTLRSSSSNTPNRKTWVILLFAALGALSLFRAVSALLYMFGHVWHIRQVAVISFMFAISLYFLWIAYAVWSRVSRPT